MKLVGMSVGEALQCCNRCCSLEPRIRYVGEEIIHDDPVEPVCCMQPIAACATVSNRTSILNKLDKLRIVCKVNAEHEVHLQVYRAEVFKHCSKQLRNVYKFLSRGLLFTVNSMVRNGPKLVGEASRLKSSSPVMP